MKEKIFEENYKMLNDEQKKAVDSIYGPVMVVAGPGTGKTQIIGMRTANILLKTDISPNNIFITTFTEAGVIAIRERLISFIGEEAYSVNISTIHGFSSDIIKTFPEKFIEYKASTAIDDVEALEIIKEILDNLIKNKKISELTNDYDKYYYLRDIKSAISNLKGEGINNEKLFELIEKQKIIYEEELLEIKPTLKKYETTKNKQEKHILKLKELNILFAQYNKYLRENGNYDFNDMINFVLEKLRVDEELIYHYAEKFQFIMVDEYQDTNNAQNEIINLITGPDLQSPLPNPPESNQSPLPNPPPKGEGTGKIKVLLPLPLGEDGGGGFKGGGTGIDSPNILVVGDDDQSIYRFQGANIENMLDFSKNYIDTEFIVLKNNYRSTANILETSSALINNNNERLSNKIDVINKDIVSSGNNKNLDIPVKLFLSSSDVEEKAFILEYLKEKINNPPKSSFNTKGGLSNGLKLNDIAIIVRNNREVKEYSDLIIQNGIEVESKQKTDILHSVYVEFLLKYLRIINDPYEKENDLIDVCRSDILGLNQVDVFKINRYLYIKNYNRKVKLTFMDILLDIDKIDDLPLLNDIKKLIEFRDKLFELGSKFKALNFIEFFNEVITSLDILEFINNKGNFDDTQDIFTLFNKIKIWVEQDKTLDITKLLNKLELYKKYNYPINRQILSKGKSGVQVMTAHSSKGLEFEVVFIPGLYHGNWEGKRIINKLKLPDGIAGEGIQNNKNSILEEDRRLFFVALTRAKKELYLSYPAGIGTKPLIKSIFIEEIKPNLTSPLTQSPHPNPLPEGEGTGKSSLVKEVIENELKNDVISYNNEEFDYIEEFLKNYKLSPSDLNVFLSDPKEFLQRVVFKYPFIDNEFTIFGKVYHRTLELFYLKYKKEAKLPDKSYLISTFDILLEKEILTPDELIKLKQKGDDGLSGYYDLHKSNIKEPLHLEYSFRRKNIIFEGVPLSGTIDKVEKVIHPNPQSPHPNPLPKGEGTGVTSLPLGEIERGLGVPGEGTGKGQQALFREEVSLIDYKTGKVKSIGVIKGLDRYGNKKPGEGNYARQLMFYKLLCELDIEFRSQFEIGSLALDFVEGRDNNYKLVQVDITSEEYEEFKIELLDSWKKIQDIDFWKEVLKK